MTHSRRSIAVSRLLLDERNARLGEEQPNQQATIETLARQLGSQLVELANDIVDNGLDPTALIAVTPDEFRSGYYRVIEGNRRVLALMVLASPTLVDAVLTPARKKRVAELAEMHREDPISAVACVVFDSEENARHWIELRHTGANSGIGLVEWDANEKDRYRSRHGGSSSRSPAGQIMDFVDSLEAPPDDSRPIISTLKRLIATAAVREKLGIDVKDGKVRSYYPADQVLKGLRTVVDDLRSGTKKVSDLYHLQDRLDYMAELDPSLLPDPAYRLDKSIELGRLGETTLNPQIVGGPQTTATVAAASPSASPQQGPARSGSSATLVGGSPTAKQPTTSGKVYPPKMRKMLIPNSCALHITDPRIKAVYHELRRLQVEEYPNISAVGLRVFIELSVDHHLGIRNVMNEAARNSTKLAKRLKDLAHDLQGAGEIPLAIERVLIKIADGQGPLSASTFSLNQYVHNQYAFPKPSELLAAWDELEPFMQALWKK